MLGDNDKKNYNDNQDSGDIFAITRNVLFMSFSFKVYTSYKLVYFLRFIFHQRFCCFVIVQK